MCAAPGSWSQVLSRKLKEKDGAKIVAVDLQPMSPIEGIVYYIQYIANMRPNRARKFKYGETKHFKV